MKYQLKSAAIRHYLSVAVFLLMSNLIFAQSGQSKLPPLIDREIFFGDPQIAGGQLSPDGQYMSFIKPLDGVRNVWVKKAEAPFESARPLTASTQRPIAGYFWSRDGKYILFVKDTGGDENFHVFAVDPSASAAEGAKVPEATDLSEAEGVRAIIFSVARKDKDVLFIGLNDRDKAWHDLYKVNISTGKRTLIRENTERISGWYFDLDDNLRLASRINDVGGTDILRVDEDGFTLVYSCNADESCGPSRFHKNGKQVYFITNKGDEVDLTRLILFNPDTKEEVLVESDPKNQVDFGGANFSKVSNELIATRYTGDKPRIYWKDQQFEADYKFLKKKFPGYEVSLGSSTEDETKYLITVFNDRDFGSVYLFDRTNRKVTFQYNPKPDMPVDDLVEMKPVRYKSLDGLEIPAYLALPKGVEAKNLPAVLVIHGGPWSRTSWGPNPFAQLLANRGYAVLLPNFRASTGYGKKFLNAGNGEWGQAMQDDLTAGAQYLIDEGIADPKRIGIFGGSYGGYATLAGLTFTPDVYAAGVSVVGPSNLITLLESIPPYWEAMRKIFHKRMGDPTTEEGKALLMKQSPLFSAKNIKAPLLVAQGANDPRVNKAESDQIVVAMRELGLPVEYLVMPDEGHGFQKPVNNMAFVAAMEKFLAKHLGGRYQEEMSKEVAEKLKAVTVDIQTVELAQAPDESVLKASLPKPTKDLIPATYKYKTTINMGGREMAMDVTRQVRAKEDQWYISSKVSTPMGDMEDNMVLARKDLMPVKREVNQGPAEVVMAFSKDKITGSMSMNGQEQNIDVDLEEPVFADGAALELTLAALPLTSNYETNFRIFEVQTQKVKNYSLKVVDTESIEVPAGAFDTYKVELKPIDGQGQETTLWISKASEQQIIKSETTAPQMNGAVLVTELQSVEE